MKWPSVISSLRLTARRFTDRAIQALNEAGRQAAACGDTAILPEHILLALALALVERGPGRGPGASGPGPA